MSEPFVAGLVRVQPKGILGAGREMGRPVRVRELPWLVRAQEVIGQLAGRLDVWKVPREVEEEDVVRAGVELVPTPALKLQFGDIVNAFSPIDASTSTHASK